MSARDGPRVRAKRDRLIVPLWRRLDIVCASFRCNPNEPCCGMSIARLKTSQRNNDDPHPQPLPTRDPQGGGERTEFSATLPIISVRSRAQVSTAQTASV